MKTRLGFCAKKRTESPDCGEQVTADWVSEKLTVRRRSGRERELPEYRLRYVPHDRVPAWVAVGWKPISAPFRWSTWTCQALGEMVIMEWERSEKPKEPAD